MLLKDWVRYTNVTQNKALSLNHDWHNSLLCLRLFSSGNSSNEKFVVPFVKCTYVVIFNILFLISTTVWKKFRMYCDFMKAYALTTLFRFLKEIMIFTIHMIIFTRRVIIPNTDPIVDLIRITISMKCNRMLGKLIGVISCMSDIDDCVEMPFLFSVLVAIDFVS